MKNTSITLKSFFTLLIVICMNAILHGQNSSSYVNVQLGIAGSIQATTVKTPAFYGNYEYFLGDHLSIGGVFAYAPLSLTTYTYLDGGREIKEDISNIAIGGLMNYYLMNEEFDIYGGGSIGYASGLVGNFLYELHAGVRYSVNEKIALNGEVGIGLSLLKLGVSFGI